MFPVFQVKKRGTSGTDVLGSVTRTTQGRENWVSDGCVGFLKAGAHLIYGRWHRRVGFWLFAPVSPHQVDDILARSEWEILDGYWGERAQIVLDEASRWHKTHFQASDAIGAAGVMRREATDDDWDSEMIKHGWDHEHCAICWEKLGRSGQLEGYLSTQSVWVCEQCYVNFVEPRSLEFIPSV
jgi:hypothetical protein